jgi:hypothetical protein
LRHIKQIQALEDKARYAFWLAGRRGGKTMGFREWLLEDVPKSPPRSEFYFIGPTNGHALELMWEPMEDRLLDLGWKFKPRVSKKRFELTHKRKIYIIGAENITRVRGKAVKRVVLDELAYFKQPIEKVWRALRPALSDLKGEARMGTTPDGKGSEAYDWWMKVKSDPEWSTHQWVTLDNPFIDPEEVEAAKRDLDPISFRQEYMATWETFGALAYYCFDENLHIKKQPPIRDDRAVILCFDFNVNPTTLLVAQREDKLRFKKEYSLKNSSTEETVEKFCAEHKKKANHWLIKIRGDASGSSRASTTGYSDYFYVEEILRKYGFKYQKEVWSANPPIIDRVKHANSYLKNVYGEHRVEIDPSCKELILDLASQKLVGRLPSDENNRGHKADAFGYCIHWEVKNEKMSSDKPGMI